jgi:hypothetical protein
MASLTKSISSLEVSPNLSYKPEEQKKQTFMAFFTVRHYLSDPDDVPKHVFSDFLPIHIYYDTTFKIVEAKQSSLSSYAPAQIDSILSAPPPWNLHIDRPVEIL